MKLRGVSVVVLLAAAGVGCSKADPPQPKAKSVKNWESSILEFERQDKAKPFEPGGVVFVGSSTIRLWDLKKSFPEVRALNRGFGGSQTIDSANHAERLVVKHRPRIIVFYAGDNDVAFGKSPETVFNDFVAFAAKVHKDLPETKIVYLSIKPSVARWKLWEKQQKANQLVHDFIAKDKRMTFIDISPVLLGADGKPRPDLLLADGLHMNAEGYKLVAELVRPHLK